MADETERFRGKLDRLCALGRRSGMRLDVQEILDVLEEEHLSADQLQLVYTYLDQMGIVIYDSEMEDALSSGYRRRSLEVYLEELDRIAALPEDAEYLLFERAAGGDREASNTLIERYLSTVCDLASEYEAAHPMVESEDLIQEANTGLVLAVVALEKESTLAAYRVKLLNSVSAFMEERVKELEEMISSDTRVVNRMNKLADTIRELENEIGHKPSVEELSAFLELPAEEIENLLKVAGGALE